MSLSEVSIKRPVLATVMSVILSISLASLDSTYLGVRDYPSVDPPGHNCEYQSYPGANSDVIISQITEPFEEVSQWYRRRQKRSLQPAATARSTISVEFDLDVDLESAANDVRDKVYQVRCVTCRRMPILPL
jgi:multidrug efflux pump